MKFIYSAKTFSGEKTKGTVEAENINQAKTLLIGKNIFVTSIVAVGGKKLFSFPFFAKVKTKEKIIFTEQLAVMIKAGFSITRALTTIKRQTKNREFQNIITKIEKSVRGGDSLSKALSAHKEVFPEIYYQVVAAGEQSGNLDVVLRRLADDINKSYQLISKIRGALVYPGFILLVMILIIVAMLIFVIPQMKSLFEDIGTNLPITTRALIYSSNFFLKFWWIVLLVIVGVAVGIRSYYQTPQGKFKIDGFKLKAPIFGNLLQKVYLARFSRTLNTLITAGLPILDVFITLSKTVGNEVYSKSIIKARTKIEGGSTISKALEESEHFPPLLTQLVEVGEESGDISSTLDKATEFFEDEVDTITKTLSSLIEPVLIVILGVGAMFVILAIIMPIYNLVEVIK